ncbi:hypothetical protein ACQP10_22140 [Streptosporangium sandarakinum]|uniref:hypothetical protein n=1 Tax=Streptosporangium sandarakinum TaxID=1260955 RepID=UPI003D8C074A
MRTGKLTVSRGDTAAWDLPFGPGHDPEEVAGRAALTARYLVDVRSGGIGALAAENGWVHRHAMQPDRSQFSLWGPGIDPESIAMVAERIEPSPSRALLEELKAAQLAHAGARRYSNVEDILYGLHVAGWGHRGCVHSLGDAETLAAIGVTDFRDYLAECVKGLSYSCFAGDTLVGGGGQAYEKEFGATWTGGVEFVRTTATRFTVAVAVPFSADEADEVTLAVISEALGTMTPGRILARLRERRGIAYSGGAIYRREHGRPVLMATASTLAEHVGVCAAELVALTTGVGDISEVEWRTAARRVQVKARAALEDPFAAVSERRRASAGQPTLAEMSTRAVATAERLAATPPRPDGGPARAVIGAVDDRMEHELESAW